MAKVFNRSIKLGGQKQTVNGVSLQVLEYDGDGKILLCSGTTVPTEDSSGFAKGCLFIKTDAADGTKAVYENQGTPSAAAFSRIGEIQKAEQVALTNTATVTAAQLLKRVIDGTPTSAATYTLPTAALLVGALEGASVGDSFLFFVNNKSAGANTITVAAGNGGTADGTLTVAQNAVRAFLVIVTNVTSGSEAYSVYGIE